MKKPKPELTAKAISSIANASQSAKLLRADLTTLSAALTVEGNGTVAERLAFARRHCLDGSLIASLEARMLGAGELAERKPQGDCCESDRPAKAKSCCELEHEPQAPSAAADDSCCNEAVAADSIETDPAPMVEQERVRQVTLRAMLACKGLVTSWLAVGGAPPTPRFEITGLLPPQAWVELLDVTGEDPLLVPVSPPPKVA